MPLVARSGLPVRADKRGALYGEAADDCGSEVRDLVPSEG